MDTVRLNPFTTQGAARLPDKDVPVLPRNADYTFDVLHLFQLDVASVELRADRGKAAPTPLAPERGGDRVGFRIQARSGLDKGARYTAWGRVAGKPVRLFQFRTDGAADTTAPSLAGVGTVRSLLAHTPPIGSCDSGEARVLLSLGEVKDDRASRSQVRYLVEGAGAPQLLTAWCGRLELRLGKEPPPKTLRLTPVDLAGNRGAPVAINLPKQEPGTPEALGEIRTCAPGWP